MAPGTEAGVVWLVPAGLGLELALASAEGLLGAAELQEVAAFQTVADQHLAAWSRVMGRWLASATVGQAVAARDWQFERGCDGARRLHSPGGGGLALGVADSERLLVIALQAGHAGGVDVEPCLPGPCWPQVAARYFAAAERRQLSRLSAPDAALLFSLLWTAKEALAKATGLPLADVLGRALISAPQQPGPQALLAVGLVHGPWFLRWQTCGADLVAACTPRSHCSARMRRLRSLRALQLPAGGQRWASSLQSRHQA